LNKNNKPTGKKWTMRDEEDQRLEKIDNTGRDEEDQRVATFEGVLRWTFVVSLIR
jgi:hypothetical protein